MYVMFIQDITFAHLLGPFLEGTNHDPDEVAFEQGKTYKVLRDMGPLGLMVGGPKGWWVVPERWVTIQALN